MPSVPSRDRLLRLPKAELHVHLDGSLRPGTLLELANERGVTLPARDVQSLAARMIATDAADLVGYLERFRLTLAVMQDAEAIERIAYELVADHASEAVRWLEVRFCPGLCTLRGLSPDQVLDAALAGLARARRDRGPDDSLEAALIVCALRTLPASASRAMAELAVAYRGRGVCAFDIAGAEAGYPLVEHREAVRVAAAAGLPVTIHAGEAAGAESIREALDAGGVSRIGHGTRLLEDPELLSRVRDTGVLLEVCLTSNVQTRVVKSYAEHPLRRYFEEGLRLSLCTDNRLMSGVTLTREYENASRWLGFTWEELVTVARMGFAAAYAPPERMRDMLERFDADVATM